MKKIILTLSIFAGLFFNSCDSDLLDKFTPGTLEEDEGVISVVDLRRLMNTTYTNLIPVSEIEFNSVFTDEVAIGFSNGGQGLGQNYVFNLNSDGDAPNGIWATNYVTIGYTNRVIQEADKLLINSSTDTNAIKTIKAEAIALRAYCHNQLVSYFSVNPKDPNALGVLKADRVYLYTETLLRVSNQEMFDFIDADIAASIALFDEVGASFPVTRGFASKVFLKALKARSLALRGDYPNALIAADDVIATSGVSLTPFANYRTMFHTDSNLNSEVIFKILRDPGQTKIGSIWASANSTIAGSPFFEMSRSLYNMLPTNDIRRSTNLAPTSVINQDAYLNDPLYNNSTEKLAIRKYPGKTTASSGLLVNDIKIMRLSEMYFIKAEAYVAANDLVNAAEEIRKIRLVRRTGAQAVEVYADQTAGWKAILDERRIEFAYEGYRYVDLKRIGALAGATIDRDPKDCSLYGSCSLPSDSYKFTLPIPTVESNANSPILSQQNPGY